MDLSFNHQVQKSDKIAIIGGGPVGVEMAGEIATDYPNKHVTIIHSRDRLIDERLSSKFLKKIHNTVKAMKINTVLGEKVVMDELNVSKEYSENYLISSIDVLFNLE